MEEDDLERRIRKWGVSNHLGRVMGYLHSEFTSGKTIESIDIEAFISYCARFYDNKIYTPTERQEVITLAYDLWQYEQRSGENWQELVSTKRARMRRAKSPTRNVLKARIYLFNEYENGKKPQDIDIDELSGILGELLDEKLGYASKVNGFSLIDRVLINTHTEWIERASKPDIYAPDMSKYPDLEELVEIFPKLKENLTSKKAVELQAQLIAGGKQVRIFNCLDDVLAAIVENKEIESCNIAQEMRENKLFRFVCRDRPEDSLKFSEAMAAGITTVMGYAAQKSRESRSKNADDYAREMYETINRLKREEKVSTFRATVEMLNKQEVPTANGGKWHIKSLQSLNKRWKDLGLGPDPE